MCHGPLVEVLESREVSYYANAEFHSIEDKKLKNSITVQVREPLLHDLALGQTFEMVIEKKCWNFTKFLVIWKIFVKLNCFYFMKLIDYVAISRKKITINFLGNQSPK